MAKVVAVDGLTVITDEVVTRKNPSNGETISEPKRVEFARKGTLDTGNKDENGKAVFETIHLSEVLPGDEIKASGPDKFHVVRKAK